MWRRTNSAGNEIENIRRVTSWKQVLCLDISVIRAACILLCAILIGSLLIVAVSAIPDDAIDANIALSSDKMSQEGNYPSLVPNKVYFQLDNWTEAAMLNMLYNGDSGHPLRSAFVQREYAPNDWEDEEGLSGVVRLAAAVNDGTEENGTFWVRSTYWLGMRIFLLPLLCLADYFSIRYMLLFVNLLVVALCTLIIGRRFGLKSGMLFFTSLIMLNWYIPMVQWCNGALCLWICTAAICLLIKRYEKINFFYLYLLIGAATSYFDWFSAPLITFGFPAIISVLCLERDEKKTSVLQYFNLLFRSGLGWCVGYGGMLVGRVLISSIVGGDESLDVFLARATQDIASSGQESNIFFEMAKTVLKGFRGVFPLAGFSYPVVAAVLAVGFVSISAAVLILWKKMPHLVPLYLISLLPFLWFIVFNGYCVAHYWIAFRVFAVTIFAWMLIAIDTIGYMRGGKRLGAGGECRAQS